MTRAELVNFWDAVFNPSFLDRISHVFMGAWQAGAFLVISVSAFYLLKNRHSEFARKSIKIALVLAIVASVLQLVTGDQSGRKLAHTQPAKLAAFEGIYPSDEPAGLWLFGWVDENNQEVKYGIQIPGMLSWLVHGSSDAPIEGLNSFEPGDRPPVNTVFQSYHAMVAIGFALILIALLGIFFWWRGTLFKKRWLLWIFVFSVLGPELANQLGWFSAEVGRQPWIVYNYLRTSEAFSISVTTGEVITSLILFGLVYLLLFILFIFLLNEKIQAGPDMVKTEEGHRA
jgi:cytochrome d ubiquinol oxidase subunit I